MLLCSHFDAYCIIVCVCVCVCGGGGGSLRSFKISCSVYKLMWFGVHFQAFCSLKFTVLLD